MAARLRLLLVAALVLVARPAQAYIALDLSGPQRAGTGFVTTFVEGQRTALAVDPALFATADPGLTLADVRVVSAQARLSPRLDVEEGLTVTVSCCTRA